MTSEPVPPAATTVLDDPETVHDRLVNRLQIVLVGGFLATIFSLVAIEATSTLVPAFGHAVDGALVAVKTLLGF